MFEEYNICPYTGLRSFTEEESIYFKGRDEHILEATAQLERNKFLMVTGASGDGKSSIVYAGIVPNARAGFLKSTYTNWQIADFRPERSPFDNLCQSLDKALGINNLDAVVSELQHGFSALVELYKSSSCFIDTTSNEYLNGTEEDRKENSRSSANLLIIVDQFEEFFTNPENYANGAPANGATLTMNLLLETAKIAQEEGLPIYVVFTMRSDYIGQCAAFRELPEFIGFSQFFVPRLNRKLLQEVIEEPCVLSGNRISRRLTERIIHDMNDGVDQLPILQHALNQIWKAADDGKEEMDLIHYAKVGGIDPSDLTDEDQAIFNQWFKELPENIKQCFQERSLHNVLNTHANKIYESAAEYYKEKSGKTVSSEIAHAIIKTTFTSLTKIDQSREVRNRMTLGEIRDILNRPDVDFEAIAGILNLFREPGNTFIRPFILDDPNSQTLTEDTVLDITHESLIRNWALLKTWAKEEYDKFVVFKDFKQQVDRWLEFNKSSGFLLPIGSLTFFEKWYADAEINKFWVNRYNEQVTDTPKNIEESSSIYESSNEFLERSAKKHAITKAIVNFGPRKIAAIIGALIILGFSSFYYVDYLKKSNDYVLNSLYQEANILLNEEKASNDIKATYIINRERIEEGKFLTLMNGLQSDNTRLDIAIAVIEDLVYHGSNGQIHLEKQAILYADSIASRLYQTIPTEFEEQNKGLQDLLMLGEVCEHFQYYYADEEVKNVLANITNLQANFIFHLIENPNDMLNMMKFNESIEMALNNYSLTENNIEKLINIIEDSNAPIQLKYPAGKLVGTDRPGDAYSYSGKYLILADLYAAQGNVQACIEAITVTLRENPPSIDYATNGLSVAGYFARYNHWDELDQYVKAYAQLTKAKPYEIYRQIANRSGYATQSLIARPSYTVFSITADEWYNPVLDYMEENNVSKIYDQYLLAIQNTTKSENELAYNLSVYYKQKGLFFAKINENKQRNESEWISKIHQDFDQAIAWYSRVSDSYLDQNINVMFHLDAVMPRRQVITFPDYIEHVPSHASRTRYTNYMSSAFIDYIIEKNLFSQLYPTTAELNQVITWIREYKNALIYYGIDYYPNPIGFINLQKIDSAIVNHSQANLVNNNMLLILMARRSFNEGNKAAATEYANRISIVSLNDLFNEEFDWSHDKTLTIIGELYADLVLNKNISVAKNILSAFPQELIRIRLLDIASATLFINGKYVEGNAYLDSAEAIISKLTDFGQGFQNFRKIHSYALSLSGKKGAFKESIAVIRNMNDYFRNLAYLIDVRATAYNGNYYEAYSELSIFYSTDEKLSTINEILYSQSYYKTDTIWSPYDYKKDFFMTALRYEN